MARAPAMSAGLNFVHRQNDEIHFEGADSTSKNPWCQPVEAIELVGFQKSATGCVLWIDAARS